VQRLRTTGFAGQPIGLATHRQKEGADGLLAVDDGRIVVELSKRHGSV